MKNKITLAFLSSIILGAAVFLLAGVNKLHSDTPIPIHLAIERKALVSSRNGLHDIIDFIDANPEIFLPTSNQDKKLLNREQRMIVWQTWQGVLDHVLFFDSMGRKYSELYLGAKGKKDKTEYFNTAFAAFLAQYRYALDFISRIEKNPDMHVLLNQAVPELGLDEGTYSLLKFRFLNVGRGAEFARLHVLYSYYGKIGPNSLQTIMDEDIAAIWQTGKKGVGPALTVKNALRIVNELGFTVWFPVQKGIAQLMGDIKVWRPGKTLITPAQIKALQKRLRPGDILLERREWFASNAGIPGFWSHAALYVGTSEERALYFGEVENAAWLKEQGSRDGTLEDLLRSRYPARYRISSIPGEDNRLPRIVEAIGEGVSFSSLEHSASADSLAVLRPNVSQKTKMQAIIKAFQYSGRPYDFNFDFRTDSELVCSELIYKAYEETESTEGLRLPLSSVMGRKLISPNDIARLFSEEYGTENRQLEFIAFLDGQEYQNEAVKADLVTFLDSWKRPKWHIVEQELRQVYQKARKGS